MPTPPQPNESKNDFIARCVSYLVKKENKTQTQALGQCYGMWNSKDKVNKQASKHIKGN